mgnify:CR=1 FL=1
MRVLTGMNLAMVIELMGMRPRFERADQIPAAELMEAGRNSIVLLNEAMENMDEEENFLFLKRREKMRFNQSQNMHLLCFDPLYYPKENGAMRRIRYGGGEEKLKMESGVSVQ